MQGFSGNFASARGRFHSFIVSSRGIAESNLKGFSQGVSGGRRERLKAKRYRLKAEVGTGEEAEMGQRGCGTMGTSSLEHPTSNIQHPVKRQQGESRKQKSKRQTLKAERGREKAEGRMMNEEIRRPKTE